MRSFLIRCLGFSLVFIFSANCSNSQGLSNSPYSRYGIGMPESSSGYAQNYSMGGLTAAMQNDTLTPFNINVNNPASYPYNRMTTFEAGIASNTSFLGSSGQSGQTINGTSLQYIAFAFPVQKWWGSGLSLQPMSSIGYNVSQTAALDSVTAGAINYFYTGSGGVDKLAWSNGFKLGGLSLGINTSYLFGYINEQKQIQFPGATSAGMNTGYFNAESTSNTIVSDLYFDYGAQYSFTIDSTRRHHGAKQALRDNWKFIFGATYSAISDINVKTNTLTTNYVLNTYNLPAVQDTIVNTTGAKSKIVLPGMYSLGLTIKHGEKLTIGIEYGVQKWSEYQFLGENQNLPDTKTFKIGGQYTPSRRSDILSHNQPYSKKISYRAGFRYGTMPFLPTPSGSQVNEAVLTLGCGMPVGFLYPRRNFNMLNIGVEIGQMGSPSLLQERFFNVVLGISLNDLWFIKPKFD